MRSKEVEDNKTDIMFYDIKTGIRINEDNPQIERGIFLDGIKITTVEEWNKAIEEFEKRQNDYIHKDKIRDKIKEIEYSCMLLLNNYEKCDTCEKESCSKRGKYLILQNLLEGE